VLFQRQRVYKRIRAREIYIIIHTCYAPSNASSKIAKIDTSKPIRGKIYTYIYVSPFAHASSVGYHSRNKQPRSQTKPRSATFWEEIINVVRRFYYTFCPVFFENFQNKPSNYFEGKSITKIAITHATLCRQRFRNFKSRSQGCGKRDLCQYSHQLPCYALSNAQSKTISHIVMGNSTSKHSQLLYSIKGFTPKSKLRQSKHFHGTTLTRYNLSNVLREIPKLDLE